MKTRNFSRAVTRRHARRVLAKSEVLQRWNADASLGNDGGKSVLPQEISN
jgi:hypothetical protein